MALVKTSELGRGGASPTMGAAAGRATAPSAATAAAAPIRSAT
jgi:hypothetical protein